MTGPRRFRFRLNSALSPRLGRLLPWTSSDSRPGSEHGSCIHGRATLSEKARSLVRELAQLGGYEALVG
jgi:hypothetical protein